MNGRRAAGWPPWPAPRTPTSPHEAEQGSRSRAVLGWSPSRHERTELGPAPGGGGGPAGGPGPRGAWEGGRERVLPQEPRGKAPPWRGARVWKGVGGGGSSGRQPWQEPTGRGSLWAGQPWGTSVGWGPDVGPWPWPRPRQEFGKERAVERCGGSPSERGPRAPLHRDQTSKGRDLPWSGLPLPQSPRRKPVSSSSNTFTGEAHVLIPQTLAELACRPGHRRLRWAQGTLSWGSRLFFFSLTSFFF